MQTNRWANAEGEPFKHADEEDYTEIMVDQNYQEVLIDIQNQIKSMARFSAVVGDGLMQMKLKRLNDAFKQLKKSLGEY